MFKPQMGNGRIGLDQEADRVKPPVSSETRTWKVCAVRRSCCVTAPVLVPHKHLFKCSSDTEVLRNNSFSVTL